MDGVTLALGSSLDPKECNIAGVLAGPAFVLGCNGSNETVGRLLGNNDGVLDGA